MASFQGQDGPGRRGARFRPGGKQQPMRGRCPGVRTASTVRRSGYNPLVMDVSIAVSVGAIIVAAVSAVYAGQTVRETRKANAVPALLDFLREYRRYESERRYVLRELSDECDPRLGVTGLPDSARKQVLAVCHYLDQLGLLVDQGLVNPEAVTGFMGESVLRNWRARAPYIDTERKLRNEDYAKYFESLVARVLAIGPRVARKRLQSVPADAHLPAPLLSQADAADASVEAGE
jgi:hypothetical protein